MNGFSVGELCIIYGALLLFGVIGILLLVQGWFFKRTFYKKYTLHVKAKVTDCKWKVKNNERKIIKGTVCVNYSCVGDYIGNNCAK